MLRAFPHRPLAVALSCLLLAACGQNTDELRQQALASLAAGDLRSAEIGFKNVLQEDDKDGKSRLELARIYLDSERFGAAEKELRRARQNGQPDNAIAPLMVRALLGIGDYQRLLDEYPEPEAHEANAVPLLLARTRAQLGLGKPDDADKTLELARAIAPDDSEVLLAEAQNDLAHNQIQSALEKLDESVKRDPGNVASLLLQGELLRMTGDRAGARHALETAGKAAPGALGPKVALAGMDVEEGHADRARQVVEAVLKERPDHLQASLVLANIDYQAKHYPEVRDRVARILKTHPGYPPAVLLDGATQFMLGNLQSAESQLKSTLGAAPGNLFARRLLAATELRLGKVDEAAEALSGVDLAKAADPALYLVAAEIARARGDNKQATAYLDAAGQLKPDNQALRTELGLAKVAAGDENAVAALKALAAEDKSTRPDLAIIRAQVQEKQYDAALASIDALQKKTPNNPLPWNYRGAVYLAKQNTAKARESWEQALKLSPAYYPAAYNLAQLDMRDGKPEAAEARLTGVLKADPGQLRATVALASLKQSRGDQAGFLKLIEAARKSHPDALEPRLLQVQYYLTQRNPAQALAAARAAVDLAPNNLTALEALASSQLAAGETDNALSSFRKLLDQSPDKQAVSLKLAAAELQARQPQNARNTLTNLLRTQPASVSGRLMLGELEVQQGRFPQALAQVEEINRIAPNVAATFRLQGSARFGLKDYDAAITAYDRAQALQPTGQGVIQQYLALKAAGKNAVAEQRLSDWLKTHPGDVLVRATLAEYLMRQNRSADAVKQYQEVERRSPNNPVVLNNLALLFDLLGDARALDYAKRANAALPDNPALQDTYGWLLVRHKSLPQGLPLLKQALKKLPASAEIRWHLAYALNASGDRAGALRELNVLLSRPEPFPGIEDARKLQATLSSAK